MARQHSMTWDQARHRWAKMYKGHRYVISCKALGVPESKEASYQAANRRWSAKRAELDGRQPRPGRPGTPEAWHRILEAWAGAPVETPEEEMVAAVQDLVAGLDRVNDKESLLNAVIGPERLAQLRAQVRTVLDAPPAPPGRSAQDHADAWHRQQQGRVGAGQLSPDRAEANRNALSHFVTFLGPHADVGEIDAQRLRSFYLFCLGKVAERRKDAGKGWSMAFAKDVFSVVKSFVRWLWEQGTVELPRNLGSKSFKFGNGSQAIKTWTVAEFRHAVEEAPGKLKLCLLLMANCGMTQIDVSDLLDGEVDWTTGRITRQRSKTAGNANVPTVQYRLWPAAFRLLQQYRSGSERVLLTETGLP